MRFVIADIHGEITKLKKLINHILRIDKQPYLVFIGDYLDKGESSYEVLKYLVDLSDYYECIFLFGNHEYIWLNLYEDFEKNSSYLIRYGGRNTIESFGCNSIEETYHKMIAEFSDFFSNLTNYWSNDEFIVVHSGILSNDYDKPIEEIPVDRLLFNRYDFLKNRQLYMKKYKIIFGHTGFYYPYIDSFKIGIDTAACYLGEQPLTAFCLDNQKFYNSKEESFSRKEYSTTMCPIIVRVKPYRMNQ